MDTKSNNDSLLKRIAQQPAIQPKPRDLPASAAFSPFAITAPPQPAPDADVPTFDAFDLIQVGDRVIVTVGPEPDDMQDTPLRHGIIVAKTDAGACVQRGPELTVYPRSQYSGWWKLLAVMSLACLSLPLSGCITLSASATWPEGAEKPLWSIQGSVDTTPKSTGKDPLP